MSFRNIAYAAVILGAFLLIGASQLLDPMPSWLFYPAFTLMGGGALYLKGLPIVEDIRRASANSPAEGRQTIIIYIVLTLVIGVAGFFYIRS